MISFIIPLHNIPNSYLEKCLKSFYSQKNIDECEIIVVNDASEIKENDLLCNKFKKYKNFKYINLEHNVGVSTARFIGLSCAEKDCCCFFDPDDFINEDSLEIILKTIKKEFLKFDIWKGTERFIEGSTSKLIWKWDPSIKEFFWKKNNFIRFYDNCMIGGKILKTKIAKDVSLFTQRVQNHEDLFFILCYLAKINYERIGKIDFEIFTICKRENSASRNLNVYEKCISFLWFMDMFYLYRVNIRNYLFFLKNKKDKKISFEMSKIIENFFRDIIRLYQNFYLVEKHKVNKFYRYVKKKLKKNYGIKKIQKNLSFAIWNIRTNKKMLIPLKKIIKFILNKYSKIRKIIHR